MTLKAVPAGAGSTKLAQRSTGNAGHAKGSKPGTAASNAKRDGPEEQRVTAKFLEAIKNPNWRQRQHSSSSSTCDLAGPDSADLENTRAFTGPGKSSPFLDSGKIEPDNVRNRKISVSDRQFNVRRQSNSLSSTSYDECDSRPERSDSTSESETFCNITRHEKLNTSLSSDAGPHIFEFVLCDAPREKGPAQSLHGSGHDSALAMLQRLEIGPVKTPDRGPSPTVACRSHPFLLSPGQETREASVSSTRDQGKSFPAPTTSAERGNERKCPTPGRGTAHCELPCTAKEDAQRAGLEAKNAAFQKMLGKLRKGPSASQPPREMRDSGYTTRWGSDAVAEEASVDTHEEKPIMRVPVSKREKRAQREFTASEPATFGCDSKRHKRHEAERSDDSGIADIGGARGHDLNPKAREFLSFVAGAHSSSEVAEQHHRLRPLLGTSEDNRYQGKSLAPDAVVAAEPQPASCAAILPPLPLIYGLMRPPLPLEPTRAPGPPQMPQIAPWPEMANDALGWAADVADAHPRHLNGAQPTPSWLGGLTQPGGLVSAPQIAASVFHSLPAHIHYPTPPAQMPQFPPPSAHLGPAARPPPVPKPRMPHAGGQQAYEAYIEQRKAMEPGYALECRLRQQRRAKRTVNPSATRVTGSDA